MFKLILQLGDRKEPESVDRHVGRPERIYKLRNYASKLECKEAKKWSVIYVCIYIYHSLIDKQHSIERASTAGQQAVWVEDGVRMCVVMYWYIISYVCGGGRSHLMIVDGTINDSIYNDMFYNIKNYIYIKLMNINEICIII